MVEGYGEYAPCGGDKGDCGEGELLLWGCGGCGGGGGGGRWRGERGGGECGEEFLRKLYIREVELIRISLDRVKGENRKAGGLGKWGNGGGGGRYVCGS